jgi:GntR family transcriptional regulator/MocR family aminotransferase
VSGAVAIRELESGTRGRGPAFLPADLTPDPHGGLYQGLYKRLRGFILDGVWPAGTRLPSSRALAADLKVSRNTAILAVEQLIADGWAESRSRSGVYVSASPLLVRAVTPAPRASSEPPPFALQRPATDLFPAQIWKQLQARAWAEIEPQRLATADPAGDAGLREIIARLVCAPRGLRCHPDQVLIVPTATAAIDLIGATLLRLGDTALVEAPGRASVRRLFEARGARISSVAVRPGVRGEHALAPVRDARLACIAPAVQYPLCTALDAASRANLIHWARMSGGWIVEDDRDADLWGDETPPTPLAAEDGERVILVGSFNRILFPGLCVAFLIAPAALAERLRAMHAMIGGRASLASQLALGEFIAEGHFARHIRRRRQAYAERRAVLVETLAESGVGLASRSSAGLHLVLDMPGVDAVAARLAVEGLGGCALDGRHLALGLGAMPDLIRAEAPRVAAAILASQSPTNPSAKGDF